MGISLILFSLVHAADSSNEIWQVWCNDRRCGYLESDGGTTSWTTTIYKRKKFAYLSARTRWYVRAVSATRGDLEVQEAKVDPSTTVTRPVGSSPRLASDTPKKHRRVWHAPGQYEITGSAWNDSKRSEETATLWVVATSRDVRTEFYCFPKGFEWPQLDEPETDWTIEWVDETPVTGCSAGETLESYTILLR